MTHLCYGSWISPITANKIVSGSVKLINIRCDNKKIYWDEVRANEKGRTQLLSIDNKKEIKEILTSDYNSRSKVNEYGGCSFSVRNNFFFFINFSDQRIYTISDNNEIIPITSISDNKRYIDIEIDEQREVIYCVQEEHTKNEVIHRLIQIDLNNKAKEKVIAEGYDFYSSVKLSPDGKRLCFICYNLPNMPWDGTDLFLCDLNDKGEITNKKKIAGGKDESICQPKWSKDGSLFFISDRTNWWNLYRYKNDLLENVFPVEAEIGYPDWIFGISTYCFVGDKKREKIVCKLIKNAVSELVLLDVDKKISKKIETPFSDFMSLQSFDENKIVFIGASQTVPSAIILWDLVNGTHEIIKESQQVKIDGKYLSEPQEICFPTDTNKKAYGFYYPPKNGDYLPEKKELPPLIVISHGGPCSHTTNVLNLEVQFWTSRGFAVVDVNYRGSTGFGRKYRKELLGNWGIVDVEDCINAAKYLIKKGLVDKKRLIIRGGSAGGYTTLAALVFKDFFQAGASYYGVSDLEALTLQSHKFESKDIGNLVAPYPEKKQVYYDRSPIHHVEKLTCPVIFFQGGQDKVVLPNQSEKMFEALKKRNIPTAYVFFKTEGHGFRQAENRKKALENELYFYSKVFNFSIKEKIDSVKIEGM
jgi:dipeptidyl aminopeptidase/acylaminoacyl peptidase